MPDTTQEIPIASVVLDIPSRALTKSFDYIITPELSKTCTVGTTILVDFAHRTAIGYVTDVKVQTAPEISRELKPVLRVLAPPAFDRLHAQLATWISREYACPLSEAFRPFLPPGQLVKIKRDSKDAPWQLVCEKRGCVDERWIKLTKAGKDFKPAARACAQRRLLTALSSGPVRVAELKVLLPGTLSVARALEKKHVVEIYKQRIEREVAPSALSSSKALKPSQLTRGQINALSAIRRACEAQAGNVILVDGITGSGKTEVYLEAIEDVIAQGKTALVLVPEIALTAQTVGRFRSRFGNRVAVLHSKLSVGERYDQWDMVRTGSARVLVGARSALFAPLADIGLIVIDEEHDSSYKQELAPRYHARAVAEKLAQLSHSALVLGSATPSLDSLMHCSKRTHQARTWTHVVMDERPAGAHLPRIQIVDMTKEFALGNKSMFSRALTEELWHVVDAGKKAMILINRRGFANFLMCRECGAVPECPHCSITLTYHEKTHELKCHECDRHWSVFVYPNPLTACPHCGSKYMAGFGAGTQRVEDELIRMFGDKTVVVRMDADSTRAKGAHEKLLETFDSASCAILVGTQMIAKGLDFPDVVLVGVLNADTTLKMPDFRAAEKSYFLLEQVAGRSGRGTCGGKVVIQTYWAGHPVMEAVQTHDRTRFVTQELQERQSAYYPPFSRIANVLMWSLNAKDVVDFSARLAIELQTTLAHQEGMWRMLGPSNCMKYKVNDRYRRHIVVKAPLGAPLGTTISSCISRVKTPPGLRISIDVDAYDIM